MRRPPPSSRPAAGRRAQTRSRRCSNLSILTTHRRSVVILSAMKYDFPLVLTLYVTYNVCQLITQYTEETSRHGTDTTPQHNHHQGRRVHPGEYRQASGAWLFP